MQTQFASGMNLGPNSVKQSVRALQTVTDSKIARDSYCKFRLRVFYSGTLHRVLLVYWTGFQRFQVCETKPINCNFLFPSILPGTIQLTFDNPVIKLSRRGDSAAEFNRSVKKRIAHHHWVRRSR